MNLQKLQQILNKHRLWINGHPDGVRVDFSNLCLSGLNLSYTNLSYANLSYANLSYADLRGADLSGADLKRVDLSTANLRNVDLQNAIIEGTKFSKFQIPQTKTLYVYKKLSNGEIAHLRIPRTAGRTATPIGNKCRAERAFVLKIVDQNGKEVSEGRSIHDSNFVYKVGETVSVPDYNDDIRIECTSGIHFFLTEKEAQDY